MLTKAKEYARLFGLLLGASFLFVRLLFGFKLHEPEPFEESQTPEPEPIPKPRHRRPAEKVEIDPMIMSVKDMFVNGQHTANTFDFEAVKESMLRGAAYMRSTLLAANPTIERLPIVLYQYTYGRAMSVVIYVDFVPSTDGVIPTMQEDQEEKLRHYGKLRTCFLN